MGSLTDKQEVTIRTEIMNAISSLREEFRARSLFSWRSSKDNAFKSVDRATKHACLSMLDKLEEKMETATLNGSDAAETVEHALSTLLGIYSMASISLADSNENMFMNWVLGQLSKDEIDEIIEQTIEELRAEAEAEGMSEDELNALAEEIRADLHKAHELGKDTDLFTMFHDMVEKIFEAQEKGADTIESLRKIVKVASEAGILTEEQQRELEKDIQGAEPPEREVIDDVKRNGNIIFSSAHAP